MTIIGDAIRIRMFRILLVHGKEAEAGQEAPSFRSRDLYSVDITSKESFAELDDQIIKMK
jgi:hypothetical protein